MNGFGFLNLPPWHEAFRKNLKKFGLDHLINAPVLCGESFDPPWTSLEEADFFSRVDTGFHFPDAGHVTRFPKNIITADPDFAGNRIQSENYRNVGIRAAIGGTFPILDLLQSRAFLPDFTRLIAITDGVISFILSEMENSSVSIEEALREAQWKGIAPGNPTRHTHGLISRERLALLGSILFETPIPADSIPVEGINKISFEDVQVAKFYHFNIRLLGVIEKQEEAFQAWIGPCLIPGRYLLARVRGGMESAYLQFVDKTSMVYTGPGTGKEVVCRGMLRDFEQLKFQGSFGLPILKKASFIPMEKQVSGYCIRISLIDLTSNLAKISQIFTEKGIQIQSISQYDDGKKTPKESGVFNMVIFTQPVANEAFVTMLETIKKEVKLATVKSYYRFQNW